MSYQISVPTFPARVAEGAGINIEKLNGVYTFSANLGNVPVVAVSDAANTYVLVQLPDGTYGKVALASITP